MEMGCDVICEKPLTTSADHAVAIGEAVERTGRALRVTFNLRHLPIMSRVKELLLEGVIGQPTAVGFDWLLDTRHGADYFRRWHATRASSGGLLVHKSTHHFDLVNWWLDSRPANVFAMGGLKFYGKDAAESRGEAYPYDRYSGCAAAESDPFALMRDRSNPAEPDTVLAESLRGLYLEAEADSGYIRDRNVFGNHVDIEDTLSVLVNYQSGAVLNYSLVAYSPWEGYRVSITGTKGRIELFEELGTHIISGQGEADHIKHMARQELEVRPMFAEPYHVEVEARTGSHGGADAMLMAQLFEADSSSDTLNRQAGYVDGAASMLIGLCGNQSIQTGRAVACQEVLPLPPIKSAK